MSRVRLKWVFDPELNGASANAPHGTYSFVMLENGEWKATFTHADTQPYRRTKHLVGPRPVSYRSPAEAMRACQRHAERFDPDGSNPFTVEANETR